MSDGGQPLPPAPAPDGAPEPSDPWWRRKRWKLPTWGWIAIATAVLAVGAFSNATEDVAEPADEMVATSATEGGQTTYPPGTTSAPAATIAATTTSTSTSTSTTTATATTTTTTTIVSDLDVSLPSSELVVGLDTLVVADEPPRVGYDRSMFVHWSDVNGSGCDARQDALDAQIIGLAQRDLVDRCVIVEGDWYSIYDGVLHAGSPSELDVDHVVALAEAWDSGAADWTTDQRQQFANDPINLIVVTASSNRSKGDQDVGEWRPERQDAWCVTAAMTILTKSRYSLTVDPAERDGLVDMVATCDQPNQRSVPGLALPGTSTFEELPPVSTTPPTTTTTTITSALQPPPDADGCAPGQVNINTASEDQLLQIIHIDAERAQQLIQLRPFSSVNALTRISGIAEGRLNDIIAQGVACT